MDSLAGSPYAVFLRGTIDSQACMQMLPFRTPRVAKYAYPAHTKMCGLSKCRTYVTVVAVVTVSPPAEAQHRIRGGWSKLDPKS